jgi:hypothetical protein
MKKAYEFKSKAANAKATAVAAAASASAAARTEELLIDYLEYETNDVEERIIEQELESSVKLRRALEDLAAVRVEIAAAEAFANPRLTDAAEFAQLHEKIMKKIDAYAAAEKADALI